MKYVFDQVDDEGLLVRGGLYLYHLKPGVDYKEKLATVDTAPFIEKLRPLYDRIKKKFKLKDDEIILDQKKVRIVISRKLIKKKKAYFLMLDLFPAIVTETPDDEEVTMELQYLS